MYEQPIQEDIFFIILYSAVTAMAMIASCYLLFRRGNAFAPDITPPARLRRWAAAFLAVVCLCHVWYMPMLFLTSKDDLELVYLVGGMLDCLTLFPVAIAVLFVMLQDRRRPLWPIAVMVAPLLAGMVLCGVSHSFAPLPMMYAYFLLMCIGLVIYMVREVRHYGRWLRDNFADMEHKEVGQSFVVLAIILVTFACYTIADYGPVYRYLMQAVGVVLVCYLPWRVETFSDLSLLGGQDMPVDEVATTKAEAGDCPSLPTDSLPPPAEGNGLSTGTHDNIGPLLQQHCIDKQLYLQHDLTLVQLAKAIGTNRFYLSQYFSSLGMTYNAYVNDLRIQHFVRLYLETVADQRPFTAQQLASDSGYRSYSTFSLAFKQRMGQTVTAWMRDPNK